MRVAIKNSYICEPRYPWQATRTTALVLVLVTEATYRLELVIFGCAGVPLQNVGTRVEMREHGLFINHSSEFGERCPGYIGLPQV